MAPTVHDCWDQLIWDHSFKNIHLRPLHLRPVHLRPHSHETFSFKTTFMRPINLKPIHLRPHSFETTFIWDHIYLRPHSFETYSFEAFFIWYHIHFRTHSFETLSFETTFIWDHIYFTPRSGEAVLIYCVSDFYDVPSTSLWEIWSFARWLFTWSFERLRPSVSRGDSRWVVNALALQLPSCPIPVRPFAPALLPTSFWVVTIPSSSQLLKRQPRQKKMSSQNGNFPKPIG